MRRTVILIVAVTLMCQGLFSIALGQGYESCTNYEEYLHWTGRVSWGYRATDVSVLGDFAYVVGYQHLKTIDVSDENSPIIVYNHNISDVEGVCATGGYLYVVSSSIFQIYSLAIPETPSLTASLSLPGSKKIDVAGNIAAVARGNAGVSFVDISNPSAPVLLSTINTPGSAYDIEIDGGFSYVSDHSQGLQIINNLDPVHPSIIGWLPTASTAFSIAYHDGRVMLGCDNAVQLVDVLAPESPELLSSMYMPSDIYGVWIDGERAYLAAYSAGLMTLDISNPNFPSIIGNIDTYDVAWRVDVVGQKAYVADDDGGLLVVSSSNDMSPPVIGRWGNGQNTLKLSGQGNIAFAVTDDGWFRSLDCS